jgi:hypothetical protein
MDRFYFTGDPLHNGGIHPEFLKTHQGFPTDFDEDSVVLRFLNCDRFYGGRFPLVSRVACHQFRPPTCEVKTIIPLP